MLTVGELLKRLDRIAPLRRAEDWDNVGLLWGDPRATLDRAMTCLTVTGEVAAEAIGRGAGAIVGHHPVLFRATKSVRASDPEGSALWDLARAGVAVLSPHTAWDNAVGGINDLLAERLGLLDVGPLRPGASRPTYKVVVFVPHADHDAVLEAVFGAGAGRIGAYSECSFAMEGHGTFRGDPGTNPTIGRPGEREVVEERRVEFACTAERLGPTIKAMVEAHSYEEPAYEVYALHSAPDGPGTGRVGRLAAPIGLREFASRVGTSLSSLGLQWAGPPDLMVERVGIVCGAGDDFLSEAKRAGADVLLTGEARYHRGVQAIGLGMGLIVAGHHETERPGVEGLADRLREDCPELTEVWASETERSPFQS